MTDFNEDEGGVVPVRALHLLTTDLLLAELISGREIATDDGRRLALGSTAARGILAWYRSSRAKWAGNVMMPDCEAIIASASNPPAAIPSPMLPGSGTPEVLRLVKIVAHRFAGLHAYGTAAEPAADFVFEPTSPITLFEGWNGSGKTSLINAVIWCLTGKLIRPQRVPEDGGNEFDCGIEREGVEASLHKITPVTPLPSSKDWLPAANARSIPADTWVELTFARSDGTLFPPIRRTQTRKPSGKLTETGPEPSELGLEPIAFTLGTTMPAMLPYLQIGNLSEMGQAVARMTGLAELVDLAGHANRVKSKIAKEITNQRQNELETIEQEFGRHRSDLDQRIAEFSEMAPSADLPRYTDPIENCSSLTKHFEQLKASGLAEAREVLGESFNASDEEHRGSLEACILPALEQSNNLGKLSSIQRLGALKLEPEARVQVDRLIERLFEEAAMLEELAANPVLEKRTQLYARVTDWMREHGQIHDGHCAVCSHALEGVVDKETGSLVSDHLLKVSRDSEVLSRTIAQWADAWTGRLARDLPEALRLELSKQLPGSPAALLACAMEEELFEADCFKGVLVSLRPQVQALTAEALAVLPIFSEPNPKALPSRVANIASGLAQGLRRLERALAFVDWMATNRSVLLGALNNIRGLAEGDASGTGLRPQLVRLASIVKGVAPINAAIELTARLTTSHMARTRKLKAIQDCGIAATALGEIIPLGSLATAQVDGLRERLHDRAEHWRDAIYQNATTFSPKPHSTAMSAKGVIAIQVGRDSVHAPAQHVSNASALRASLMGFYLAFREHVLATSGGLALIVLDDPQDLLDYENRARLARGLDQLAESDAQILATTHDRAFGRTLVDEARKRNRVEHRAIHPVHASRRTLETSLAIDDLDRKRNDFIKNDESASHAQDYANQARIFLEARLGDLFDDPAYPAFSAPIDAPTLMPHVNRLKSLVTGRSNELFRSTILARFCDDPAFAEGANVRRVLNEVHHGNAQAISYADVKSVDADIRRLRSGIEAVHGEFRRFRWREPLTETLPDNVVPLTVVTAPSFNVPIVQDIAAFSRHMPGGGQPDEELETLSSDWFANKALFYIRNDTMGFVIPAGSVAIVESAPSAARDHELVVGRVGDRTYARRLLRPRNGEGFSLAAEATDPRQSRPTLAFEDQGLDLHRVVGALFGQLPPPAGRQEAIHIDSYPALGRVEVAYRVREESAVPRIMPDQIILGGPILTPDQLDTMEDMMVAVTLDDGSSILKRVGAPLSGAFPYLRQFETIGGLGASVVLATERVDGAPDVPLMLNARPVIGVVYEH